MPNYGANSVTNSPMTALYPGDSSLLFNNENPASGQASQQVAIASKDADTSPSLSFELIFPANPGAFEFDIQDADTDTPDAYLTLPVIGQILNAVQGTGGKWVARVESVPIKGRFVRVLCVTQNANAQTCIFKVSR